MGQYEPCNNLFLCYITQFWLEFECMGYNVTTDIGEFHLFLVKHIDILGKQKKQKM